MAGAPCHETMFNLALGERRIRENREHQKHQGVWGSDISSSMRFGAEPQGSHPQFN
jgi:hypothetical protein